jgi:hypothetical protein
MKKSTTLLILFFFVFTGVVTAQSNVDAIEQLDPAIKRLADELNRKLNGERVRQIAVGQFSYNDTIVPLSSYWANQISADLSNIQNRTYTISSGITQDTEWIISGEIVEVTGIIRVYTRLVRLSDRAIVTSFNTDIERGEGIAAMLSSAGGRASSNVPRDAFEPDSYENPVPYEIGSIENAAVINRTIHDNDEDFFLLIPATSGRLVMETTGNVDTYMEFYDAASGELLAEDDDGGSGYNARIRYNVQAGRRYIAKVKGYGSDDTGNYGFKAYLQTAAPITPDEYEVDDEPEQANWIEIGEQQQHTFHHGDDIDWVKFQITKPGRYAISAKGVTSNDLDTCIELFDENMIFIGENDDGGEYRDSLLEIYLASGLYFLKVYCLDSEPDEPYIISIIAE